MNVGPPQHFRQSLMARCGGNERKRYPAEPCLLAPSTMLERAIFFKITLPKSMPLIRNLKKGLHGSGKLSLSPLSCLPVLIVFRPTSVLFVDEGIQNDLSFYWRPVQQSIAALTSSEPPSATSQSRVTRRADTYYSTVSVTRGVSSYFSSRTSSRSRHLFGGSFSLYHSISRPVASGVARRSSRVLPPTFTWLLGHCPLPPPSLRWHYVVSTLTS